MDVMGHVNFNYGFFFFFKENNIKYREEKKTS